MATVQSRLQKIVLPGHLELPETDGTFVENMREHPQSILTTESIREVLDRIHPDGQYAIGQDTGIYYKEADPAFRGAKSPDWFYVPGVPPLLAGEYRRSCVLWKEFISPLVLLDLPPMRGTRNATRPG